MIQEMAQERLERVAQAGDVAADIKTRLEAACATARAAREAFADWFPASPPTSRCLKHGVPLAADRAASLRRFAQCGEKRVVFVPCPACAGSGVEGWLLRAGVPLDLVFASFENYSPQNATHERLLSIGRKLVSRMHGTVVTIGPVGTGKSHIGAACLRAIGRGRFCKQRQILDGVRRRYDDGKAVDIVLVCQTVPFLVLDEFTKATATDEKNAITGILDHRIENNLPTFLSSNLPESEVRAELGGRMLDRLTQKGVLVPVSGQSFRGRKRAEDEQW